MTFCRWVVWAMLASASGCGDGDGSKEGEAAKVDVGVFCQTTCGRQGECGIVTDVPACVAACKMGWGDKLRADYFAALEACVGGLNCQESLRHCQDRVDTEVPLTAAGRDYCDAITAKFSECGRTWETKDLCHRNSKPYSDSALNEARNCAEKTCRELTPCIEKAIGTRTGGDNACASANNGICDEPSNCPEGTDSRDCEGGSL